MIEGQKSSIEKEIKKEVALLNLTESEKPKVYNQLKQFRGDHMPLAFVKIYLHNFRDYYRYGKNPSKTFNGRRIEVTRTQEQQIADRFKVVGALGFDEYELTTKVFKAAHETASNLSNLVGTGTGLLLLGDPGLGKTALAKSICNDVADHAFVAAPRLIQILKDVTNKERELIKRRFVNATLLVIDDLGQEYRSEFTDSEIDYLIAERERNDKSIIITSNFTVGDMESVDGYAKRMIDRLKARCFITELKGESYRQKQKVAHG